jgi:hypothetical protein
LKEPKPVAAIKSWRWLEDKTQVTEERLSQAGWINPSKPRSKDCTAEAAFTGSTGGVRALPESRETGTVRSGTIRNRSEPSEVIQASFELE